MKLNRLLFLIVLLHQYGFAQPATEVYLLDIKNNATSFSIDPSTKPVNISNNEGYDNQPSFIEKLNAVAYVSSRNKKPTDVYLYDLATAKTQQFTNNKEAEYSPKTTPDGKFISVVKDTDQNLTRISLDGLVTEKLYTSKDSIGYYCWLNKSEIAAFTLSKPKITLKLIHIKNKTEQYLTDSIGRSLYKYRDGIVICQKLKKGSYVSFIDKKGAITQLIELPKNTEDFYLTADGWLFSSNESKLIYCNLTAKTKVWQEVANLKAMGISKIFRLAVNQDKNKLVFVAEGK
ncbi:TolB family protein [Flavobacterium nackdongense]|uniref:S9 family peptidase n=1 Tax=Flavobacterium nackdongense TaxID=2547394 RepID=A0A4P6Y7A6_9FLAO|nr:hypothetical protein [Flavobacterium nackdongense]QBN18481.1 hypothetical protein E1750_06565 [Flavobacterium nackdongense]